MWVLGTEAGFSTRAVSALHPGVIVSAPLNPKVNSEDQKYLSSILVSLQVRTLCLILSSFLLFPGLLKETNPSQCAVVSDPYLTGLFFDHFWLLCSWGFELNI